MYVRTNTSAYVFIVALLIIKANMAKKAITKATQLDLLFPEDNQVSKTAKTNKRKAVNARTPMLKKSINKPIHQSSKNIMANAKPKNEKLAVANKPTSRTIKSAIKKSSKRNPGLAPDGFVRLTINIRQELRIKLKVIAAKQNTTIGKLIEEFANSRS